MTDLVAKRAKAERILTSVFGEFDPTLDRYGRLAREETPVSYSPHPDKTYSSMAHTVIVAFQAGEEAMKEGWPLGKRLEIEAEIAHVYIGHRAKLSSAEILEAPGIVYDTVSTILSSDS